MLRLTSVAVLVFAATVSTRAAAQSAPQQPPQTPTEADTSASSSRMVGNSALSHGGPPPTSGPTAAGSFSPAFQIGQRVIVASDEYASQTVSLLTSPPDSAASVPASRVTRTLSGGVPSGRVVLGVWGSGVRAWAEVAPADAACQTPPFLLKHESRGSVG